MGKTASLANIGTIADSSLGFRNRIINGGMTIDQRNAGASVPISANNAAFTLDRYRADAPTGQGITVQQSNTAPAGFKNSLLFTAGTASTNAGDVSSIQQFIEGFNVADFGWGAAGAQTVTISFWVRSSLTGNFGLSLRNSAGNRTYVASFNIAAANTFEYKTITITGDTSGTWVTDNGRGIVVMWDMGVGTTNSIAASSAWGSSGTGLTGGVKLTQNTGATFYITGVQLEKGSTATSFDYRPYGTELQLAQRYCYVVKDNGSAIGGFGFGQVFSTTVGAISIPFPVTMRTMPSSITTAGSFYVWNASGNAASVTSLAITSVTNSNVGFVNATVASGLTAGNATGMYSASSTAQIAFNSEL